MLSRPSVLIVDPLEETRAVLRTALERRGVEILEASLPAQGVALARRHRPDLVVLDLECCSSSPEMSGGEAAQSLAGDTALVLLGSGRRRRIDLPAGQFVSKPYHYAPLIRRIEELLDRALQPAAPTG